MNSKSILYIDLGPVTVGSLDKRKGRILGWAEDGYVINYLIPGLNKRKAVKNFNQNSKVKVITLPLTKKSKYISWKIILEYIKRLFLGPLILWKTKKYDFTFCNSGILVDFWPGLLLKLLNKSNELYVMIDSIVPEPKYRSGNYLINLFTYIESRLVINLSTKFGDGIFTVNDELKKSLLKSGVNKNKVILSKNGIYIEKINQVKVDSKKYLGVYMGRITENKGVNDLLEAWRVVIKTYPGAILAVMGTGTKENRRQFKQKIEKLNLEKNVRYFGFVHGPKKYKILKESKIFIFLSRINSDESWGISLMEALACGLPAVTYDLKVFKNIYPDNVRSIVKLGEVKLVAEEIKALAENPELRTKIGNRGKKFSKNFKWSRIAENDLKAINKKI